MNSAESVRSLLPPRVSSRQTNQEVKVIKGIISKQIHAGGMAKNVCMVIL